MSNSIFLFDNQIQASTVVASSAVIPADNVKNPQRRKFWRSDYGTTSDLQITLDAVQGITHFAFVDVNLTTGGTIRIQAWDDAMDGSVNTLDQTFSPSLYVSSGATATAYGFGNYGIGTYGTNQAVGQINTKNITLIALDDVLMSRYIKITFTDTNVSYQQVSNIFLGQGFTFQRNLSYGWSATRVERNSKRESIGGQTFVQPRDSRLKIQGSFNGVYENERTEILIRMQILGNRVPFIFSVFPETSNQGLTTTVYGVFDQNTVTQNMQNQNTFNFSVTEEL